MCTFYLKETQPTRTCQIENYLSVLKKSELPAKSIFHEKDLPIDSEGLCIYHSRNAEWKVLHHFDKWIDVLIEYLKHLDKAMYFMSDPPHVKRVDLTGIFLIGKERKMKSGSTETTLKIQDLTLNDHIEIDLHYAEIADPLYFEDCLMKDVDISFNNAVVNAELYITNTTIGKLTFNNCSLNGGILMNKCDLSGYAEFGGLKARNVVQLCHVNFETHAYFNDSLFNCETVFFEHLHFLGKADFSQCTFFGDVEIQECHFEQQLNFTNAAFNGPLCLTGNYYDDNVYFISNEKRNRVFHDNVNFLFIDKENEVQERIIFDNVNYYYIGGKDREELNELARLNKVTIGSGCIKYRVQTSPIEIKTNDISGNIARELAHSFTNYFTSSTGTNLGVEFIENTINSIKLFYFTDEDITQAELLARLKTVQGQYWKLEQRDDAMVSREEIAREIDMQVSKLGITLKMGLLRNRELLSDEDIETTLQAINFDGSKNMTVNVNITNKKYMNIKNITAQPHSQVNIAEEIKKIEFNPQSLAFSQKQFETVKKLLVMLDDAEVQSLQTAVNASTQENDQYTTAEKIRLKFDELSVKHGVPIMDGITSSVIFEILKNIFQ